MEGNINMGWIIGAIGLMGGFVSWYMRVMLKNQAADIKEFVNAMRDQLRVEFSGRFLDATLAAAKLEPMTRDIAHLQKRIDDVEDYAHKRCHDLANEIQACRLLMREK